MNNAALPASGASPDLEVNIGADLASLREILENRLGAAQRDGFWNFDKAKTLVLFRNGS